MKSVSAGRRFVKIPLFVIAVLVAGGLSGLSQSFAQEKEATPIGLWKTVDDNTGKAKSLIRIWKKKGVIYGTVVKLINPPVGEENPLCDKCKGSLHNKPVVGMTIMTGLKKQGDEWRGGKILDPESGNVYRVKIKLENNGKKLMVRGFMGISLLGRTQHWIRVK